MKLLKLPSPPAFWARGLSLCLLALPAAGVAQQAGYQVQGNYNPGLVTSQPATTTLLPQPYQQQPYEAQVIPPANTGLRTPATPAPGRSTYVYSPLPNSTRPVTAQQATVPVHATPNLPTAYAQQGVYAQPQPYPVAVQQPVVRQEPTQVTYVPIAQPAHAISEKDREQDRRITALEQQRGKPLYVPSTPGVTGSYTKHVVRRGESLWGIAERYGVSESAIKAANRRSTDMVIEGETLLIPSAGSGVDHGGSSVIQASNGTHIVRRGESLSKIAVAYRVSTTALQQANGISNPDLIQEGQPLVIPGISGSSSRPVVYKKPKSASSGTSSKPKPTVVYSDVPTSGQGLGSVSNVSGPRGVTSYRVEAGDKIENVARTFNSTPAEIQRINKLSSPSLPAPGEEIIVPLPGSVAM